MSSQLKDAINILMKRKKVIVEQAREGGDAVGLVGLELSDDSARRMFIGTDLDVDETIELGDRIATLAVMGIVAGEVHSIEAITGMWIDGLLTGMILSELRAKKEKADDK